VADTSTLLCKHTRSDDTAAHRAPWRHHPPCMYTPLWTSDHSTWIRVYNVYLDKGIESHIHTCTCMSTCSGAQDTRRGRNHQKPHSLRSPSALYLFTNSFTVWPLLHLLLLLHTVRFAHIAARVYATLGMLRREHPVGPRALGCDHKTRCHHWRARSPCCLPLLQALLSRLQLGEALLRLDTQVVRLRGRLREK